MQTTIPKTSAVLGALLRSDFTTQWRNRRAAILVLLVPVIILISWKGIVDRIGAAFIISTCITLGLTAIGLMGYSNSIARDRDKGVFQRLRVSPVPAWSIMISRLAVQMGMILLLTTLVFVVGYQHDHIKLSAEGYVLGFLMSFIGGAVYLGMGQIIVGLLKNAETVNSTTRLVYFVFIMVGMFGELDQLGSTIKNIVRWSPYGTVKSIISAGVLPSLWNNNTTMALGLTIAYALFFSFLGIKWFRWNTR